MGLSHRITNKISQSQHTFNQAERTRIVPRAWRGPGSAFEVIIAGHRVTPTGHRRLHPLLPLDSGFSDRWCRGYIGGRHVAVQSSKLLAISGTTLQQLVFVVLWCTVRGEKRRSGLAPHLFETNMHVSWKLRTDRAHNCPCPRE